MTVRVPTEPGEAKSFVLLQREQETSAKLKKERGNHRAAAHKLTLDIDLGSLKTAET